MDAQSNDEIFLGGKKFLSLRKASLATGYHKDYLGQICRQGLVACQRIGNQWFVEEKTLFNYESRAREEQVFQSKSQHEQTAVKIKIGEEQQAKPREPEKADKWDELFLGKPAIPIKPKTNFSFSFFSPLMQGAILLLIIGLIFQNPQGVFAGIKEVLPVYEKIFTKEIPDKLKETAKIFTEKIPETAKTIFLESNNVLTYRQSENIAAISEVKEKRVSSVFESVSGFFKKTKKGGQDIFRDFSGRIREFIGGQEEAIKPEPQKKTAKPEEPKISEVPKPKELTKPVSPVEAELVSLRQEIENLKISGLKVSTIVEKPTVIEKTIYQLVSEITRQDFENQLSQINNKILAQYAELKNLVASRSDANFSAIALSQRINTLSNVAISSPTISGSGSIAGASLSISGTGGITGNTTLSADLTVDSGTLYVDSSNNRVGIGTTSPQYTLDVEGTLRATSLIAAGQTINGNLGATGNLTVDGNSTLGNATTSDIVYLNSRLAGHLISTSDNLLDIGDGANWLRWRTGYFGTSIGIAGTATSTGSQLTTSGSYLIDSSGTLSINTSNNQNVVFGTGNIGIGTTSPYAKLSVVGPIVAEYFTATSTSATSTFSGGFSAASSLYVLQNGNVGIGTTSPGSKLEVSANQGGTSASILARATTDAINSSIVATNNTGNRFIGLMSGHSGDSNHYIFFGPGSDANNALVFATSSDFNLTAGKGVMRITNSGYVGIGTTSPWAKLAVNPVAGDTNQFVVGSSTATSFVITPAGNVGIGTAGPGSLLEIESTNSPTLTIDVNHASNTGGYLRFNRQGSAKSYIALGSDNKTYFSGDGTNNHMILDTTGNVGIGTAAPRSPLTVVSGTQNTAGDTVYDAFIVGPNRALTTASGNLFIQTNDNFAVDQGGSIAFGSRDTTGSDRGVGHAIIKSGKENATSANLAGYLTFATRPAGGTPLERMRIDSTGNVGIGTTSPAARLDVVAITEQLRLKYDPSNYSSFTIGSTGDLTIAPSGGDTSITGNLAVSGAITGSFSPTNLSVTGNTILGDASVDTLTLNTAAITSASPTTWALANVADALNIDSNTLSIDALNNRVGIGTAAPRSPLTVVSGTQNTAGDTVYDAFIVGPNRALTTASGNLFIQTNDNFAVDQGGSIAFGSRDTTGSDRGVGHAIIKSGKENATSANLAGYLFFATRPAGGTPLERMRIDSGGNVGIGTTTPVDKLHVAGTILTSGAMVSPTANSIALSQETGYSRLMAFGPNTTTKGNWRIYTGSSNGSLQSLSMSGDADGNVGIGTAAPGSLLEIESTNSPTLTIDVNHASNTGGYLRFNRQGSAKSYIALGSDNKTYFSGDGTNNHMILDRTGNVGIGTTNPTSMLHLGSTAAATPTYSFTNNGEGLLFNYGDDAGARFADLVAIGNTPAGATTNLRFWTNSGAGAGTATEKMRITGTGNVGIGDASPAALLTVGANDAFQVNSSGLITTASVGTAALKTATGNTSGTVSTDINLNDYMFFPSVTESPPPTGNGWTFAAYSAPDPSNTIGKVRMFHPSPTGTWIVRWRYITASDRPTIWVIADSDGSMPVVWESEDPVNQHEWPKNPNPFGGTKLQEGQYFLNPEPLSIDNLKILYGKSPLEIRNQALSGLFDYILSRNWIESISSLDDISLISERYQPMAREWALRFLAQANNIDVSMAIRLFLRVDNGILIVADNPQQNLIDYKNQIEQARIASESLEPQVKQSDIAEFYSANEEILSGELVAIDSETGFLRKTNSPYEKNLLGVISTSPSNVLGNKVNKNDIQLALIGRVPVKVSLENGPIKIGDKITSSSLSGVGMKATSSGMTVGIALESLTSESQYEAGKNYGKILVFVNLGYHKIDEAVINGQMFAIDQSTGRIKASYGLDLSGNDLVNVLKIVSSSGLWSIDESGKLIVQEIETQKLKVKSPLGFTIYDEDTNQPVCVKSKSGALAVVSGECGSVQTNPPAENPPPPPPPPADTEPPVITIHGNNPAQIPVGTSYGDLGASAVDNIDGDISILIRTYVNGLEMNPVQIDTSTTSTSVIDYAVSDRAGNFATSSRQVIITNN